MVETDIQVKLDHFDGPLAVLLHLIHRQEMPIEQLDLTQITGQYLQFLSRMEQLNFDLAGEYLFMAATLIYLKSQHCLSEDEAKGLIEQGADHFEIQSKADLIRRLEELEKFQLLSKGLWALPKLGQEIFVHPKINRQELSNSILAPCDQQALVMSMVDFIRRERRRFTLVRRDRLSIKEKLIFLKNLFQKGERRQFSEILSPEGGVEDLVISFISVLELARLQKLNVFQNDRNGPLYLDIKENLDSFDVESANGFDEEQTTPKEVGPALEVDPTLLQ